MLWPCIHNIGVKIVNIENHSLCSIPWRLINFVLYHPGGYSVKLKIKLNNSFMTFENLFLTTKNVVIKYYLLMKISVYLCMCTYFITYIPTRWSNKTCTYAWGDLLHVCKTCWNHVGIPTIVCVTRFKVVKFMKNKKLI